ncbi:heavy metal-associated isoprenylated plant protein 35-like isoform X2 [Phragmites australis]|uniref:heavy metal-associated isoprenylated plant protein 35-like isoform X2 n=1 Tax=Phragmites australis TaxID=29695 RepID=UPI002D79FC6A|nr:heavy metal-associated isoprenylated plant protein 35-like isoform X2 [Phragmites australis]
MASGEAAPAAVQTVVLRVSIHCHGCKKKVRKVLKSVEGVHNVAVDGAQHKVTVTGTVDADTLVKRLYKSGKQAVPWQWHPPAAAAKKPEGAPAPEALPAPETKPSGDGGKDVAAAAADKKPEETVKEQQAESSEKKPEAEKETESKEEGPKEEAKKDAGESKAAEPTVKGAEPVKEAVAAIAKEASNDEADDAKKKKKNRTPKDDGEAEPVATAERSLSAPPVAAPKHAYGEYIDVYAPQPVLSYHMAQPSASLSHYAPQPQPAYSVQQPQPQPAYSMQQPQPMQQWSPSYLYMSYPHSAPESYYHGYYSPSGTHSSPTELQDSYRLFDDENPNSCSVM